MAVLLDYAQPVVHRTFEIAKGSVSGARNFGGFGRREAAIGTNTVLWGGTNTDIVVPPPTGISDATLQSTSIEDSQTGTGFKILHIHYIDVNGDMAQKTISTDGTNPVSLGITFIFINCMHLSNPDGTGRGTAKYAVGDITVKSAGVEYSIIKAGSNRCMDSFRMVPSGYRYVVTDLIGGANSATANARVNLALAANYMEGHYYKDDWMIFNAVSMLDGSATKEAVTPAVFPELSIVLMLCDVDKAATISASHAGYIERV